MGVDASYLYGYGAKVDEIEWDVEYLREKYKDKLAQKARDKDWSMTYGNVIGSLEGMIHDEEFEELYSVGEELGFDVDYVQYDGNYLTIKPKHIAELYPDEKLKILDELAKTYARQVGVKNTDIIKWIEFGYFD